MFYFFIRILTLCIVSVTIYGADVVECQFSKQNQNDTDAVIWKITIPTEVAQKFNVYKNFLPENDNNEPIPYIYSADMHPYLTKTIVEKLFNLAANKENSSLITSPAEVEHMARVANMLEATQEINELLLRTKPAEQFIQELFAPAPKRWHNWFTYHIQSTDDGTNDLRLYVSTTIAQSPELKKHYKPLFYNWLYTCPEWQKADATLTTLKPIKKHVEIPLFRDYNQNDSDNPAFEPSQLIIQITDQIITYYPTQTLCSDLQKWKDSNLFKSYAAVFPEDKLTTLYEEHLSELLNMRDQCIQEKTFYYNNNKYPESFYTKFGITDRWKDLRPFPIKKYADSIHLPFLIHFVQYGVFLLANDRNINRITVLENDCNADTVQIPVVLKKVDVQTLQKIIFLPIHRDLKSFQWKLERLFYF